MSKEYVPIDEGKTDIPHRFEDFWCNINESLEERANFHLNPRPLFKFKRVIWEVQNIDGSKMVISKSDKQVLLVEK